MHGLHESLVYLLALANIVSMLHLGMYIVGANAYDILQARKGRRRPGTRILKDELPLVSVIVPAHNEALVIRRTLDSIRASSYPNLEIIVVDDGSTDGTLEVVRNYQRQLPQLTVESRVARAHPAVRGRRSFSLGKSRASVSVGPAQYTRQSVLRRHYLRVPAISIRTARIRQKNAGKAAAMNNAIMNYARGEFVMCLDADSMLHPRAIERAVAYFADPKVIGVAANVRVMPQKSIISTVQRFEHMIGYRSKKFYSLTNSEFIVGGVASTYRMETLRKVGGYDLDTITEDIGLSLKIIAHEGNRAKRIVYAPDVVAMTEGVQTFKQLMRQRYRWKMGSLQNLFKYRRLITAGDSTKYSRMLTHYRLPMALLSELLLVLEPLLLMYIVYLSIAYRTVGVILGAYMTVTIYVLWVLWPDEHLTLRQKLHLSLTALYIYALFYIMDIVQIAAVFRCLKTYRNILWRTGATTWTSPARTGQTASF